MGKVIKSRSAWNRGREKTVGDQVVEDEQVAHIDLELDSDPLLLDVYFGDISGIFGPGEIDPVGPGRTDCLQQYADQDNDDETPVGTNHRLKLPIVVDDTKGNFNKVPSRRYGDQRQSLAIFAHPAAYLIHRLKLRILTRGRFFWTYRRRFGELPSQTIRAE